MCGRHRAKAGRRTPPGTGQVVSERGRAGTSPGGAVGKLQRMLPRFAPEARRRGGGGSVLPAARSAAATPGGSTPAPNRDTRCPPPPAVGSPGTRRKGAHGRGGKKLLDGCAESPPGSKKAASRASPTVDAGHDGRPRPPRRTTYHAGDGGGARPAGTPNSAAWPSAAAQGRQGGRRQAARSVRGRRSCDTIPTYAAHWRWGTRGPTTAGAGPPRPGISISLHRAAGHRVATASTHNGAGGDAINPGRWSSLDVATRVGETIGQAAPPLDTDGHAAKASTSARSGLVAAHDARLRSPHSPNVAAQCRDWFRCWWRSTNRSWAARTCERRFRGAFGSV